MATPAFVSSSLRYKAVHVLGHRIFDENLKRDLSMLGFLIDLKKRDFMNFL